MDRATLDKLYNNREAVPTHPQDIARWATESARARAELPHHADLAYGPHPREILDLFTLATPGRPLLVFIHGGYWQAMSKGEASQIANGFVRDGLANVALLNYPIGPEAGMDQIVASIRRAILWLWHRAGDYGFDRRRIHVSGHSAGGHLAVMALLTDWPALDAAAPADLIKGAFSISGLYDLRPIRQCYLNDKLGMDDAVAERNSPLLLLPASTAAMAPLVCAVGGAETPAFPQQQHDFVTAWKARGGRVTAITAPDRHHFDIVDQMAQPGAVLQTAMAAMLR
ncbi:MAG: alpha/beta hydrolase fold domain-containing protein [Ferrovibrio sp.]|uniref:alpha/beta hydrolase n=1 Tax=Ferrovibrio sp. TaxID=1917215 RepID=UPI00262B1C59|nr:alpha/beta hydrolase [Ferrovibrio sp.]MCW0234687.1 alpha/beta hydrolase fold domain-containing protein [Ferrovibrio sp.]